MTQNKGAIPGSRASHQAAPRLAPPGFDPERKCVTCGGRGKNESSGVGYVTWERCIWCHGRGFACNACDPVMEADDLGAMTVPEAEVADIVAAIAMEAAKSLRP